MASTAAFRGASCPCSAHLENVTQKRGNLSGAGAPTSLVQPFTSTTARSGHVVQRVRQTSAETPFNERRALHRQVFCGQRLKQVSCIQSERTACRQIVTAQNTRGEHKAGRELAHLTNVARPVKGASGAPRTSVVASALKEKEETARKDSLEPDDDTFWRLSEPWDIPWTGKTTAFTMTAWLIGFVLTGIAVPLGAVKLGYAPGDDADSKALFVLAYELAQTAIGLTIIWAFTKPFQPLGDELFKFDLRRPLARKDGWALYALGGFLLAFGAVQAAASATGVGQDPDAPRDAGDALMQLLPIIGASPLGTASLIVVTGVCAPLLEETVFRGFFLPSLTKWLPTWAAILISAFGFAAAHVTPGELPQLTALGVVLGITYTQTRNLACPMLIHSLWNSGVIIVLTVLKVNGVDIKEFV
ncbi:CAAX amino terminal motif-containing protease [Klebsormidium nitens]|uniref:CAAX amino terminal motif-containing protease n=1 Tax=Klebsormidium nitens TaxID=105231 RepID=A0A0U9HHY3_KLENI|nr:CAAX amino terminal motif-containing protease [Klebsormidium nitens]|eukprot:GAQ77585.1 CAAX amino terminal motif-containing protease [Klebsormidium nitens]